MTPASTLARAAVDPRAATIDMIVTGRNGDPFAILGPHPEASDLVRLNAYHPDADRIEAVDRWSGGHLVDLDKMDSRGFFTATVAAHQAANYKLRLTKGSHSWEVEDPYRFSSRLGELDLHLLGEGNDRRAHDKLGAHAMTIDSVTGVSFAVWAPNATRASVIGPFNDWDGRRHPMRKHPGVGIWDLFIPGLVPGDLYKYEFLGPQGQLLPLKADPYGQSHETPPATASRVARAEQLEWHDAAWMARRGAAQSRSAPISIYEVHLGSWRRGAGDSQLDYDQIAAQLIPYVRDLGFTHIELMPVAEYPFGGSWGYQPIGMFSPTSRFGSPEAFGRFVDQFHEAGIGVLLDWVPAHFPNDAHGLVRFDGTALYEHEDPRRGFHKDWNTLIYNYGRREVANFLQSNALFWLERYHLDGLRVDAVASMLYLDYSRKSGEWVPNQHGGRENIEAIAFLRSLNTRVYGDHPGAITVAEESTAWPQVSRPVDHGGLGFGFKWNMGWMHDTLKYISEDPINRRHHHDKMTFGLLYAWDENFVLPISHDEVVHGKGSLLARMPGDQWQRFANLRAYLGFMWTHPGKKLLFMGCEFGQEREWQHDHSLDWHLLDKAEHKGIQSLIRDLNAAYRSIPALYELDCEPSGFQWVDGGNSNDSVLAYLRKGAGDAAPALAICNFTPVVRHDYRVGVPTSGRWTERLNSDAIVYGGSGVALGGGVEAEAVPHHGQPHSIRITLPPLATLVLTAPAGRGAAA